VSGTIEALGARARFNVVHSGLDGRLELPKRILNSQEHNFSRWLAHVFGDPKHPAHGFYFHVQIEFWITNVRPALEPNGARGRVQILVAIAHTLDASLDFFHSKKLCFIGHAKFAARCFVSMVLNNSFSSHRRSPQ
jgi:hypothetical protein